MPQKIDTYQGMQLYAVSSVDDLALPALLPMLNRSWQTDYHDQERLMIDESLLRWLLVKPGGVAVLVCDETGQPVGFDLACERTLYAHQQPYRAYYNSLFTVSAHHRRRGLGTWMLRCMNHVLFTQRRADVVLVAFHPGHAGLPTVQNAHQDIPGWGVQVFHGAPILGRRFDLAPLPEVELPPVVARIAWPVGSTALTLVEVESVQSPRLLPSVATLTETIRHYGVACGLDNSFRSRYLAPDVSHAGTFWYEFGSTSYCWVSFDMVTLVREALPPRLLGRIQTVYHCCTAADLLKALAHICRVFIAHECCLTGVLDHGFLPSTVLQTLGFRNTGDTRLFAVRGPQDTITRFTAAAAPPYVLDL